MGATADRLNQAAERAAEYGLRVGYHNHTQEFAASFGGRSAFEVFAEQLRDDVTLEVDLYWAATAKQDVPALLGRLGDRVKALHVKDGFLGPDPFADGAPPMRPLSTSGRPDRARYRYWTAWQLLRPPSSPSSSSTTMPVTSSTAFRPALPISTSMG